MSIFDVIKYKVNDLGDPALDNLPPDIAEAWLDDLLDMTVMVGAMENRNTYSFYKKKMSNKNLIQWILLTWMLKLNKDDRWDCVDSVKAMFLSRLDQLLKNRGETDNPKQEI